MVTTAAKPDATANRSDDSGRVPLPILLRLPDCWEASDAALIALSRLNESWGFELTADGELVVVSPEGLGSSHRGARLIAQVVQWSDTTGGGIVFGPQMAARLPDASVKMPDCAWVSEERWAEQDVDESALLVGAPDLVIEIVSVTDDHNEQQEKLDEWMANGVRLGWLIDPFRDMVIIYRPNAEPEQRDRPDSLSGEDVCEGLVVKLERIWK